MPTSFCKTPTGDRKISDVFVFCIVRSSGEEGFLENSHPVLFLSDQKAFFLTFCVFWDNVRVTGINDN